MTNDSSGSGSQGQPTPESTPPSGQPMDYAGPQTGAAGAYQGPPPTKDDMTMGMLCHLLAILTGFVGPLVIWLVKKDTSPFVDDQGKEALNFQITMFIGYIVGIATACLFIGMFIIFAVWIASLVFCILGSMQASKGVAYRYPFAMRLIK